VRSLDDFLGSRLIELRARLQRCFRDDSGSGLNVDSITDRPVVRTSEELGELDWRLVTPKIGTNRTPGRINGGHEVQAFLAVD
jgi:hypothetical protein